MPRAAIRYHASSFLSLTAAFAVSDFRLRFHGSVLGVFWSFLRPLFIFSVLYFVFSIFVRFDIPYYSLHLLLGVILWNFFAEATIFSLTSLDGKAPLVRKIYFPRVIVIISATVTSFIALLFNLVVFLALDIFVGPSMTWTVLYFLFYLILLYGCALGTAFLIASLFPKFRDIRQIWDVLLQLGFWVTPIIYSLSMVPAKYHPLIFLNPLARIIEYSRDALIFNRVESLSEISALFLMTGFILGVGYLFYSRRSKSFAEDL